MEPPKTWDTSLPDEAASAVAPAQEPAPEGGEAAEPVVPGGFWRRFAATLLDGLIIYVALLPATILLWLDPFGLSWVVASFLVSIAGVIFFIFCWARWGATPGKRLMGLRIVRRADLGKISGWRATGRYVAYLLATIPLGLGLLWAAFNKERRGWHDMLAGTRVLRVPTLRERGARRERRLVLGAIALGTATLTVFFALTVALAAIQVAGGTRDASGAITTRQPIFVFSLRVGDCFDLPKAGLVSTVYAAPCRESHEYEMYATQSLSATRYPTDEELLQVATDGCISDFEPYTGVALGSSTIDATYIAPDETAWRAGSKRLMCVAYDGAGAKLTRSLRAD